MVFMDDRTKQEPEKPYSFMSGGINDYLNEINQPKQPQDIDEYPDEENLSAFQDTGKEDEPLETLKARAGVAKATGALLATALDAGLSTLIGTFIAKGDPADYKADEEQKSELETAMAEYVKLKGGDIPPGIALLIVVLSIYMPKGVVAFQVRKLELENAEKDRQIAEMQKKLQEFGVKQDQE